MASDRAYYDWDGNPITVDEWIANFQDNQFLRDKRGGYTISTIYLGRNRHGTDDQQQLIFETRIFGVGALDGEFWRYPSKEAAEEGHRHAVTVVDSALAAAFAADPRAEGSHD